MNNEILNEGLTTPPETSHTNRVINLKKRSEAARLKKVTSVSQRWEQIIARRPKAFHRRKEEKPFGTVAEFMKWMGHAIDHEYKRMRQRRSAAYFAIELANNNGQPHIMRRRQLSKQWRRLYGRAAPKQS